MCGGDDRIRNLLVGNICQLLLSYTRFGEKRKFGVDKIEYMGLENPKRNVD